MLRCVAPATYPVQKKCFLPLKRPNECLTTVLIGAIDLHCCAKRFAPVWVILSISFYFYCNLGPCLYRFIVQRFALTGGRKFSELLQGGNIPRIIPSWRSKSVIHKADSYLEGSRVSEAGDEIAKDEEAGETFSEMLSDSSRSNLLRYYVNNENI